MLLHKRIKMKLPTVEQMQKMAKAAYDINVKNGFWDNSRSGNDLVFLMKSEVFEAGECYRKHRVLDRVTWEVNLDPNILKDEKTLIQGLQSKKVDELDRAKKYFENYFKETVEMEIADVIIRIFDCMMGYDIPFIEIKRVDVGNKDSLDFFTKLDELLHSLYNTPMNKETANQFAVILSYLFSYDENMSEYIRVKTIYNSTRGYMHGGKKA